MTNVDFWRVDFDLPVHKRHYFQPTNSCKICGSVSSFNCEYISERLNCQEYDKLFLQALEDRNCSIIHALLSKFENRRIPRGMIIHYKNEARKYKFRCMRNIMNIMLNIRDSR